MFYYFFYHECIFSKSVLSINNSFFYSLINYRKLSLNFVTTTKRVCSNVNQKKNPIFAFFSQVKAPYLHWMSVFLRKPNECVGQYKKLSKLVAFKIRNIQLKYDQEGVA